MNPAATQFVDDLAAVSLPHVFNPYADHCPLHDRPDAADRRRRNLAMSLDAALALRVKTVWIARDLGYRGGRRTGLALTDEAHLDAYSTLFEGLPVERATVGPPVGERTANIIWGMLGRLRAPVFLWNVFPLHPHEPDNPMSNRCHTAHERDACGAFLPAILELLAPDQVFAIGGDAHRAVDAMGIKSVQVRHPSYGGQSVFVRQIEEAYGMPPLVEHGLRFTRPVVYAIGPHIQQ